MHPLWCSSHRWLCFQTVCDGHKLHFPFISGGSVTKVVCHDGPLRWEGPKWHNYVLMMTRGAARDAFQVPPPILPCLASLSTDYGPGPIDCNHTGTNTVFSRRDGSSLEETGLCQSA